ncbi:TraB domain-containing protein [Holothuria leucospilota]|uniref:TraB domain-containing protein n=1 Tax=Holothuria leucospilota TaxID=206669 RepID=A0A9Q1HJ70_HOLLE|nr:TraB domain-containing protein [Holothuria leucospilota]
MMCAGEPPFLRKDFLLTQSYLPAHSHPPPHMGALVSGSLILLESRVQCQRADDVERYKQKDLLEEMLGEMTGEFPGLSDVFVTERDLFLAQSLKLCAQPVPQPDSRTGYYLPVVVGIVGMGHVPGIVSNWTKECTREDIAAIVR